MRLSSTAMCVVIGSYRGSPHTCALCRMWCTLVKASRTFLSHAMVMRAHIHFVLFLVSALVRGLGYIGSTSVFLTVGIAQPGELEASAMALAPFPCMSASAAGCVSEPFGALASSAPPGWGRARRPCTQVARVCFTAIWARPVCPSAEVLHGRGGYGWGCSCGCLASFVNAGAAPVCLRLVGLGILPSAEGAVRAWACRIG